MMIEPGWLDYVVDDTPRYIGTMISHSNDAQLTNQDFMENLTCARVDQLLILGYIGDGHPTFNRESL